MTIPAIFHWPSPWLWGAIGVLILADSHGFWDWIQGSAWLVLFASVVYYCATGLAWVAAPTRCRLPRVPSISALTPSNDASPTHRMS